MARSCMRGVYQSLNKRSTVVSATHAAGRYSAEDPETIREGSNAPVVGAKLTRYKSQWFFTLHYLIGAIHL